MNVVIMQAAEFEEKTAQLEKQKLALKGKLQLSVENGRRLDKELSKQQDVMDRLQAELQSMKNKSAASHSFHKYESDLSDIDDNLQNLKAKVGTTFK